MVIHYGVDAPVTEPVKRADNLFSLSRAELFRIIAVIAPAAFLRFFRIGQQSYWADEVQSIWQVNGHAGTIFNNIATNFHGPLHFTLLLGWGKLGGWEEGWTRSLSALAGVVTIWLFYLLARRIAGRKAALWAIILMAASPFHIWYSQEVRNYVFLHLFTVLSMLFFMKVMEQEREEAPRFRGSVGIWAGYLAASAAALLCNLAALFLFAVQGIYALIARPRLALKLVILMAAVFLVLLPWIMEIELGWSIEHIKYGDPLRRINFHPLGIPYTYLVFSLGESVAPPSDEMHRAMSMELFKPYLPYLILAFITYAILIFKGARSWIDNRNRIIMFLLWLLVPLIFVSALAILNLKVFQPRYASVSFPGYLILIAAGLAACGSRLRRVLIISIIILTFFSLDNHYNNPRYWKPDLRSAVGLINQKSREGDVLAVYSIMEPVEFYYRGPADLTGFWPLPGTRQFRERSSELARRYRRVWLLSNYGWYRDPAGTIPEGFNDRFELIERHEYNKVTVHLFRTGGQR
ncbi:MAG: phospholipid carrier-dependent glycosyltransferase [Candidatus Latescibacteria bacterium]|nr:phospholipid carrier-dependent glycosyltransferase [bacterium]MBD3425119.1 phospholipid carrier-dependent glycosyltransferase [Candidatus Latescibacterota bacterium]